MLKRLASSLCAPFFALCLAATPVAAAPVGYALQPEASTVGFSYFLNAERVRGQMPVAEADIRIDFTDVSRSSVSVTLLPARADAGLPFATEAMLGGQVLDVANHPTITFQSRSITGSPARAQMQGDLTIRGITRPVTLQARLYRQRGQAEGDLSQLTILLTGRISRGAFGADGFPQFVQDPIDLSIRARIQRAP
ncbi:YceI family protein [Pseudoruegeria sp. SHC-113]|nr:YceI family protein [Pseudoruegeria sp. SHC-113]